MSEPIQFSRTSVGKKQIVALTGLLLIVFVVAHLAGNLLIYGGPDIFNAYAKKMASMRPVLYIFEFGLLVVFIVHMYITALLVIENYRARPVRYKVEKSKKDRSLGARIMPISGVIVLVFVVWHLMDFTFVDHHGPKSYLRDGNSYGLYGVVYNAFSDPVHSMLYIIAMAAVGFHLSHGIQSCFQTLGYSHPVHTPRIVRLSNTLGLVIAFSYSSIPVYILIADVI